MRMDLVGLQATDFYAETDQRALDALKRIPLLPTLTKKFFEHGIDRWMYVQNMAMCVRCGPRQYATVYGIMRDCARRLDMQEPELYLTGNPFPNAFAGGVERPYITLRSSILDTLNDEQLVHIIGHELGHIKAGHILYMSMARVLAPLMQLLGRATLGLGDVGTLALVMALAEWSRQAELTADRAGLLACQDLPTSMSANLALAAGPSRFAHEAHLETFVDQARAYQEMSQTDMVGKAIWFMRYGYAASHPMPVYRTQALERWVLAGSYDQILRTYGSATTSTSSATGA
ncbi:MAG: M48 family metallopeptidase [Chthonomonas sp.]|nr:M48 family metallopeptidase [Chthonomonas sp.]